jgi:hypothetical protein
MPVVYVSDYIQCTLMEHFFLLLQHTRFAISKYRAYKTSPFPFTCTSDQGYKLCISLGGKNSLYL